MAPLPDPAGIAFLGLDGIGRDIVSALGSAILSGIESGYNWVFAELVQSLDAPTDPGFTATASLRSHGISPEVWFTGPWGAMVAIGVAAGVLILGIGAISHVLQGRSGELGRQILLSALALVTMVSKLPLFAAQTLFDLVDDVSSALPALVFPDAHGLRGVFIPPGATRGTPAYASAFVNAIHNGFALPLLLLVGLLASFAIWLELAAREAFAYLVVALLPLAMAGLFWRATERWLRHLVNVLVAIAMSQVIISLLLVMAGACYEQINSPGQSVTQSITQLTMFIAFLCLATFSLPMALRIAPHTVDGALVAGHAARTKAAVGRAVRGAAAGDLGARRQQAPGRLTQAGRATSGGAPAGAGGAGQAGAAAATGTGVGAAAHVGFVAGGLPGALAAAGRIAAQQTRRLVRNGAPVAATGGGNGNGVGTAGPGPERIARRAAPPRGATGTTGTTAPAARAAASPVQARESARSAPGVP